MRFRNWCLESINQLSPGGRTHLETSYRVDSKEWWQSVKQERCLNSNDTFSPLTAPDATLAKLGKDKTELLATYFPAKCHFLIQCALHLKFRLSRPHYYHRSETTVPENTPGQVASTSLAEKQGAAHSCLVCFVFAYNFLLCF